MLAASTLETRTSLRANGSASVYGVRERAESTLRGILGNFALPVIMAVLLNSSGCTRPNSPEETFEKAFRSYVGGDFEKGSDEAEKGERQFAKAGNDWPLRFRALRAEILVFGGESRPGLEVLQTFPANLSPALKVHVLALRSVAQARLHQFDQASADLREAQHMCEAQTLTACGGVLRAEGFLAEQRGDFESAAARFQESLDFARVHHDAYLEATALLNLGFCARHLHHYDEAIDWLTSARKAAVDLDAGVLETKAIGDLGDVYYSLGDFDQSLEWTLRAKQRAIDLHDSFDELAWEMDAGQVYAALGENSKAAASFQQALARARRLNSKQDIADGLTVLAALGLQTGDIDSAERYCDEALAMARGDHNRANELDPLLIQGTVAARRHDETAAQAILNPLIQDPSVSASLKSQSEYALARMFQELGKLELAERSYEKALANFESARAEILHDDLRLPFLTNATNIYEDYIDFLIGQGKSAKALAVADFGRAQTLAEGLGLAKINERPQWVDPRLVAAHEQKSVLFYALGQRRSYLWVITSRETRLIDLPPRPMIDAEVQRYRKLLASPLEPLTTENSLLFQQLVEPVLPFLNATEPVVIVPDGSLNGLNFETLVVPAPQPHYWIEDVTLAYASSLRILARTVRVPTAADRKLLLIGAPVFASKEYSPLPHAKLEMEVVSKHFEPTSETVLAGELATPLAYVSSQPERFSFLHFVAHGTANRLSPLDSAVILSKASSADESYKLYARTILQKPLHAELVTISSCYGSGSRTYSGEGLVGLSWAFLRAGAHHVIGALWEVSDDSTPQLMNALYSELAKGEPVERALRNAKLSLLHSGSVFRRPFYWGPFQLYSGS